MISFNVIVEIFYEVFLKNTTFSQSIWKEIGKSVIFCSDGGSK
jgi:hypothetical protein